MSWRYTSDANKYEEDVLLEEFLRKKMFRTTLLKHMCYVVLNCKCDRSM